MKYDYTINKNTLILKIKGEIDDHGAKLIRKDIDEVLENKKLKNMIVDLKDVEMMDSAGIGLLIGRYKLIMQRNGKAGLVIPKRIQKVVEISGLKSLYLKFDSVEEGIIKFS